VLSPLSSPENVEAVLMTNGYVMLAATYYPTQDDDPADMWKVWTAEGRDPIPGTDTPYNEDMISGQTVCTLFKSLGTFTVATDFRIMVRVYRSTDLTDDGNSTVYTVAVPGVPSAPVADALAGAKHKYH